MFPLVNSHVFTDMIVSCVAREGKGNGAMFMGRYLWCRMALNGLLVECDPRCSLSSAAIAHEDKGELLGPPMLLAVFLPTHFLAEILSISTPKS
jgi:hypothetical protein